MTQEEKNLLIKDLCCRLPYSVKVHAKYTDLGETIEVDGIGIMIDVDGVVGIEVIYDTSSAWTYVQIDDVKPYLFPLLSMTEEQMNDCPISETNLNIIKSNIEGYGGYGIIEMPWQLSHLFVDWCNKNHFDYLGLIPMGLANDATGLNIY